jgi:hypothetical protein
MIPDGVSGTGIPAGYHSAYKNWCSDRDPVKPSTGKVMTMSAGPEIEAAIETNA